MRSFESLARWPLLLGAALLFAVALWETSHETEDGNTIAEVSTSIACVLLGAWVWSLASEAERKHHRKDYRKDDDDGA